MSTYKLISVWALAVNAAINWRAKLASEKLHCADFVVHNLLIIMAVIHNHDDGQKSRHAQNHNIYGDHDLRFRDFFATLVIGREFVW